MRKTTGVRWFMGIFLILGIGIFLFLTPALCDDQAKIHVIPGEEASSPKKKPKDEEDIINKNVSKEDVKLIYSPALPLLNPEE